MTTKMSVTRALATLKNLDAKIEKAIPKLAVVALTEGTGGSLTVLGRNSTVEQVTADIVAQHKSLNDMVAQRSDIKSKVIQSNAATKVTVGNTEMTVAEAIEMKKSINFKSQLLAHLRRQSVAFTADKTRATERFNTALERAEAGVAGRDRKATEAELEVATAGIKLRQTPGSIDPLNLAALIEKLEEEISDFTLNVDFALSEINAKTEIEVA